MSSNYTHNAWAEKASGQERKDAVTFHTAKVMATLNAPLRKEMASFLQKPYTYHKGLFAVTSVKAFCHLTLVTIGQYSQHRICTREGNRVKERQHGEQTYNSFSKRVQ